MTGLAGKRLLNIDLKNLLGLYFSLLGLGTIVAILLFRRWSFNLAWAMVLLIWVLGVALVKLQWGISLALTFMLFTGFLNRISYNFGDVDFQFLLAFPELVTVLLVGVWVLRFVTNEQRSVRFYWPLDVWVLVYLGILVVQIFNPVNSVVVGLYGARLELVPILMYFFSRFYFRNTEDIVRFYKLLIVLGNVIIVYGLFQQIWGLPDIEFTWFEYNPAILAQKALSVGGGQQGWFLDGKLRVFSLLNGLQEFHFLVVIFFILLFVYRPLKDREIGWRVGRLLFLSLFAVFLALSLERTPIAMIIIGVLAAFVIRAPIKYKRTFYRLIVIGVLGVSFLIALNIASEQLIALSKGNVFVLRLVETASPFSAGAVEQGRLYRWVNTVQFIAKNPLGYGLGSTLSNRSTQMGRDILEAPHNYYLRMAMELGVLGSIAMLVLYARILYLTMRQMPNAFEKKPLLCALLGTTVAIMVCGMFNNPLQMAMAFYFWFLIGLIPVLVWDQRALARVSL